MSATETKSKQIVGRYTSFAEVKGSIHRPSLQRDIDPKRIKEMREHIHERVKAGGEPYFGAIDLCYFEEKLWVNDGQHRLKALEEEYENGSIVPFNAVIYYVDSREEMATIFRVRNKGVPVPDYILKPPKDAAHGRLLRSIESWVNTKAFFGNKHNRPNINTKVFMDHLAESKLITHVGDLKHFQTIFEAANNNIKQQSESRAYCDNMGITQNMLSKCKEKGIYIGLDKNMHWLDNMFALPS